jgi:hypothetical protein
MTTGLNEIDGIKQKIRKKLKETERNLHKQKDKQREKILKEITISAKKINRVSFSSKTKSIERQR